MDQSGHLATLQDESRSVTERIRAVVLGNLELDYWDDPKKSPPNLAEAEFRRMINYIPINAQVRWEPRGSKQGTHGNTGENKVFNIEFEVPRGKNVNVYYLKGYFFDDQDLKGACIQSFRIDRSFSRQKLSIVGGRR